LTLTDVNAIGTGKVTNKNTTLKFDLPQDGIFDNLIAGGGELIKSGDKTLTLTNIDNVYSGTTTVNGGILEITGTDEKVIPWHWRSRLASVADQPGTMV